MFARSLANGAGFGALTGAAVGGLVPIFNLASSGGVEPGVILLVIYGAVVGTLVGALIGVALGLILAIVLRVLLGPSAVPRRKEQLPTLRVTGAAVGLLPVLAFLAQPAVVAYAVAGSSWMALVIVRRIPHIVFGTAR